MKKLLFTAIAVIGFSVSGMANTVGVDDSFWYNSKFYDSNYEVIDKIEDRRDCSNAALDMMEALEDSNLSDDQIAWWGGLASALCYGYSLQDVLENSPYPCGC